MRLPFFLLLGLLLLAAGCTGTDGDLKGPAEGPSLEQSEGDALPSLLPANSEDRAPADAAIAALVANPSAAMAASAGSLSSELAGSKDGNESPPLCSREGLSAGPFRSPSVPVQPAASNRRPNNKKKGKRMVIFSSPDLYYVCRKPANSVIKP